MADNFIWSTSLGRWTGIPVRVHMLFYLFIAVIFGADWNYTSSNSNFFVGTAMVTFMVLCISLAIHEIAHIFALNNLGGHVSSIVFMPWGGDSEFVLPENGNARALIHLSGPFANAAIVALGTTLLVQSDHSTLVHLLNPFDPKRFDAANWQISLTEIITWVNFQLFIVNLIPCFPFDGAKIVRAIIASINIDQTKVRVESAIQLIGNAIAFGFIGMAYVVRGADIRFGPIGPTWLLFLLIGIALLFASKYSFHMETRENEADLDDETEDVDYDSGVYGGDSTFFDFSEHSENTAYSQWLQEKQEARRDVELRKEVEEDRRADDILKKLHHGGISSLSDEERLILDRVSARIRRRRQQGV